MTHGEAVRVERSGASLKRTAKYELKLYLFQKLFLN